VRPTGGGSFAAFVRVDGSVWAMGRNQENQLGDGTSSARQSPVQVATNGAWLAAGATHQAVVKLNGNLSVWGGNAYGQLGDGTVANRSQPIDVAMEVSTVAAGAHHTAYVQWNAKLWTMGRNDSGQLGDGSFIHRSSPRLVAEGVQSVTAGLSHTLFVKTDGTLWAMGANDAGQFGNGGTTAANTPVQVGSGMRAVAAGASHSLVIDRAGTLWASGGNGSGQLGDGTTATRLSRVSVASGVVAVAAGAAHSVFLKSDGTLWGMGANDRGQLGLGHTDAQVSPVQLATDVAAVSAGASATYYVRTDGTLWAAGANDEGQLGDNTTTDRLSFVAVASGTGAAPTGPEGLGASYSSFEDRVSLGWSAARGALHYDLWRYADAAPAGSPEATPTRIAQRITENHFQDLTAAPGRQYWYGVEAVNSHGVRAIVSYVPGLQGVLPVPPSIVTQPESQAAANGFSAAFRVGSAGSEPLTYRWQWQPRTGGAWTDLANGVDVSGATQPQLAVVASLARHGGRVRCIVTNAFGTVTSAEAYLWMTGAVSVQSTSPARTVAALGAGATLTGSATSLIGASLTYQWKKNNRPIAQATQPTLTLSNLTWEDAGAYTLEVRDAFGGSAFVTRFLLVNPGRTQVRAWGANASGQTDVPLDLNDALAVAAGRAHSVAMRADGSLVLWGDRSRSQASTLANQGDAVALSARGDNTLYVRSDGSVRQFGAQLLEFPIEGAIAASTAGSSVGQLLRLRHDGTVGAMNLSYLPSPQPPAGLREVISVAAGLRHSVAVKSDGTVVLWGDGMPAATAEIPSGLANVQAVAAGEFHTLALRTDGTVVAWGDNSAGQCTVPTNLTNVVAIAAGAYHSVARRADGSLVMWGRNSSGETTLPVGVGSVLAMAAGDAHTLAVRSSTGDTAPSIVAQTPNVLRNEGETATFTVIASGSLPMRYQWRFNGVPLNGANGTTLTVTASAATGGTYDVVITNHMGSITSTPSTLIVVGPNTPPALVERPPTRLVMTPGQPMTLSVTTFSANQPLSYQWHRNNRPIPDATASTLTLSNPTNAAAGAYTLVVTDSAGLRSFATSFLLPSYSRTQVVGWGFSYNESSVYPAAANEALDVVNSASGLVILRRDGTVVSQNVVSYWAANQPSALAGVVALRGSNTNVLALRADGTPVVWGDSSRGLLSVPSTATGLVDVSLGVGHALALTAAGRVIAWGSNFDGEAAVPAGLQDVVQIAAGGQHSLALKRDGTVVAWGRNSSGQATVPAGLTDVVSIAAGGATSFAIRNDGSIVAWGLSDFSNQTVVPSDAAPATRVIAGPNHVVALRSGGALRSWGANTYGQQTVPENLAPVVSAFIGESFTLALRDASGDAAPTITAEPAGGRVAAGGQLTLAVSASGAGPLRYQWRRNGVALTGQTARTLLLQNLQPLGAGNYDVVVSNHVGSVTSATALVEVTAPPAIVDSTPRLVRAALGAPLSLSVSAISSDGPLTYQWRKDNRVLGGATAPTLTFSSFRAEDAGTYTLEIVDRSGFRTWFIAFVRAEVARTQVIAWDESLNSISTISTEPVAHIDRTGVAVRRDGTVFALIPGTQHPAIGRTGVAKVAGQLLLNADGTVESVSQTGGQIHVGLPPGLSGVVDLQVANDYAFALKADGSVVAWGSNDYGQLNFGTLPSDMVQVALGVERSTYFLRSDGSYLAHPGWFGVVAPPSSLDVTSLARLAPGYDFVFALRSDRSVFAWGGLAEQTAVFPGPASLGVEIASSDTSVLLRTTTGAVRAWGRVRDTGVPFAFTLVADNALAIFRTQTTSFAVRDASADDVPTIAVAPVSVTRLPGESVTFTVAATGAGPFTYQWRKNGVAITGATTPSLTLADLTTTDAADYDVVVRNHVGATTSATARLTLGVRPVVTVQSARRQVALPGANASFSVVASGAGTLRYQWFQNGRPLAGETGPTLVLANVTPRANGYYYVDVNDDVGPQRSAAMFLHVASAETRVIGSGWLYSGNNLPPSDLIDAVAIASSSYHSLAIRRDGTVVSWGTSAHGQSPVPAGLTDVVAVAGGNSHSLALKSDGTVVVWGINSFGQLDVPTSARDIVAIASGPDNCIAIKRDGSVVTWGGYFFRGSGLDFPAQTRAVGQPFAGSNLIGVIDPSGAIQVRGFNQDGVLNVPSDAGVLQAASSQSQHVLALRRDGTVISWGNNLSGETTVPADLRDVIAVAAGGSLSVALKADGTVAVWGSERAPEPAPGSVFAISASSLSVLALQSVAPASLVITGQPLDRTVLAPGTARFTVGAAGPGPLSYRWQRLVSGGQWTDLTDGGGYSGATTAMLDIAPTKLAMQGDRFRCIVSNGEQSVTSESAQLGVSVLPESAPSLSLSTSGTPRVGRTLSITLGVGDANGDLEFAALWVRTPLRGWLTLRSDGSVIPTQDFTLANAIATAPSSRTVDFALMPVDGPGTYTIAAAAIDATGQRTDRSIEILVEDNRLPTGTLFLSGERTMGETVTASLTVGDPDGNFAFANLRVQTPNRGWIIVRRDNSVVVGETPDAAANSVLGSGSVTRPVSFTALDGAGNYTFVLTVVDALGARFDTAPQTIAVQKIAQNIAFDTLPDRVFAPAPVSLVATASSGLPVSFDVVSGPASVDGAQLTLTGAGSVVVRATQAGDAVYSAAPSISRTFVVLESYASWQLAHFSSAELLDEAIAGPAADPDADRLNNLIEYALGTDPRSDSTSRAPSVSLTAGGWTYTYTRPASRTDLTYVVERSSDLVNWNTNGVTHVLVGTVDGIETWRATVPPGGSPNCFFRLRVTR
jgi:alpha-tubulin suppressor-like RCC1 family protein